MSGHCTGCQRKSDPDPGQELREDEGKAVEEQIHQRLRARREDRNVLTTRRTQC